MASQTLTRPGRAQEGRGHEHHLRESIADELHHLREIEEEGDSPLTALIVVAQVVLALFVIVAVEMTVAMSFYFGWL